MAGTDSEIPRGDRFMPLLMMNQPRIFGFILALVHNRADADDLMQQATVVMWRKFDEFEPDRDFGAWALGIARYTVLDYRKRRATHAARLSEKTVESLADVMASRTESPSAHRDALHDCLSQLGERDRRLVTMRYEPGATTRSVAEHVGRSADAVYKRLNRIHTQLLHCIRLKLRSEGSA